MVRSSSHARLPVTKSRNGWRIGWPSLRLGVSVLKGWLVTAQTLQGMAPYPGQASCLALNFWPECSRRLNVKGGRRSFPKETRSALDIEGKHVTIQGPSPDLTSYASILSKVSHQVGA